MATMVNVHEKMSLSDILARVSLGEEIFDPFDRLLVAQTGGC
jgi:PIN domain nuclease of toxin-antitoxin system